MSTNVTLEYRVEKDGDVY